MEAALKIPPPVLRKLVELMIPPAAREGVCGDLWERYRGPGRYLGEAIQALPFVIASQIRRNANLPLLALQASFAFFCAQAVVSPLHAAGLAAAFALILLLQAAYQGTSPPSASRAALETVVIAIGVEFVAISSGVSGRSPFGWTLRQQFFVIVPFLLPLLCLFRTRLGARLEMGENFERAEISAEDIIRDFGRRADDGIRRNRIETCAFLAAALCGFLLCWQLGAPAFAWNAPAMFIAAAAYLALAGAVTPMPSKAPFSVLRAHVQRELLRRNQLRQLMWWFWLTPVLYFFYRYYLAAGLAGGDLRLTAWGASLTLLACFIVGSINRERGGRIQETVGSLSRLKERKPA
jgi:hypothetical protein